jgi:hypothetical protein
VTVTVTAPHVPGNLFLAIASFSPSLLTLPLLMASSIAGPSSIHAIASSTSAIHNPRSPLAPSNPYNLTQDEQQTLKAAIFQRLHPRVYLERFVAEGVRPDGRELGKGADGNEGWRGLNVVVGQLHHQYS